MSKPEARGSLLHLDTAQADAGKDEFAFKTLAQGLALSISGLLASTAHGGSFVVALEGKWGSGKSTILNYVRAFLEERLVAERQFIVDFDPWWLVDGTDIASSLLATVLSTLPQEKAKVAARAVGSLARAVGKLPEGVEALLKLSEKTKGVGEIVEAARSAGGDLSSMLNAAKPPRRLREDVAKAFQTGGFQFIVFIDDLDRLAPKQALDVMSAIRSVADLPGFVYVLAYDPVALENILRSSSPPLGHDYVEKIVNVSLPVPPITFSQMAAFTGKLLEPNLWAEMTKPGRESHKEVLVAILQTPRDAIRFANSVNFWIGSKTQEVFIPDFLVLEAIRLARPSIYDGLLKTSDIWLDRWDDSVIGRMLGNDAENAEKIERRRNKVDAELRLGPSERDEAFRRALAVLFPRASRFLGQRPSYRPQVTDALSISLSEHFFTYFLPSLCPGRQPRPR